MSDIFSPLRFAYLILSKCRWFPTFCKETKDSLINWNYCGHQKKELRLNNIKPIFNMESQNLRKGCKQLCFGPFRASGNKSLYWPLVFFAYSSLQMSFICRCYCKQHTYYIRIVAFLKGKCSFFKALICIHYFDCTRCISAAAVLSTTYLLTSSYSNFLQYIKEICFFTFSGVTHVGSEAEKQELSSGGYAYTTSCLVKGTIQNLSRLVITLFLL